MLPRKATDWAFETQTCSSKQKQRRLCFALINLIGPQWLMDRKGQNKEMHSTKFIQKALHIAVYILPSVILIAFDQKKYCCASDLHWVNYAQRTIFLFFVTIHTKLVILIIFVISNARQCVILLYISHPFSGIWSSFIHLHVFIPIWLAYFWVTQKERCHISLFRIVVPGWYWL